MGTTDRLKRQIDNIFTDRAVGPGQGYVADMAIHHRCQAVKCRANVWDVKANNRGRHGEVANGTTLGALADRLRIDRYQRVNL